MANPNPCYQLNVKWSNQKRCDKCGRVAEALHMPTSRVGVYCEQCCPVCSDPVEPPTYTPEN
jgi:hypothetical protein